MENRAAGHLGIMSAETTHTLIAAVFAEIAAGGQVTFAFQGGEPTLAGLSYFEDFVEQVHVHNQKGVTVQYAIQTNGLALDTAWAQFFQRHHFLVGVSVDGDKAMHDRFRLDSAGKGTYLRVCNALRLLKKHHVETNLLCVVTGACAKSGLKVYQALKKHGQYLQFIPCLDPLDGVRGAQPYSLTPERYGQFLCTVFDAWYRDWKSGHYTSVRLFDDYVHLAMGLPAGTCATSGHCGAYLVVESDGSVYPCDFYCLDAWRLGQIGQASLSTLCASSTAQQFLAEGAQHPSACMTCPYARLCNGGCKRDWVTTPAGKQNYFCTAFQTFFAYAGERLFEIAHTERQARMGY